MIISYYPFGMHNFRVFVSTRKWLLKVRG